MRPLCSYDKACKSNATKLACHDQIPLTLISEARVVPTGAQIRLKVWVLESKVWVLERYSGSGFHQSDVSMQHKA